MTDRVRGHLLAGLTVATGLVLVGPVVGLVWAGLAPRARVVALGSGAVDVVNAESEALVGADGTFFVLTLVVGIACGVLAYRFGRRFGAGTAAGLGAGGLAGAVVAAAVGREVHRGAFEHAMRHAPVGTPLLASVQVRAQAVLLVWAVAALATFVLLVVWREPD